ncbi:MAG: haloacid dehalogenase, partial [Ornithinimicrobium sp.]
MTIPPAAPLSVGSAEPLLERHDAALLDLDGVIYTGERAVPGAVRAVGAARAARLRTVLVTNNATRTPEAVVNHL